MGSTVTLRDPFPLYEFRIDRRNTVYVKKKLMQATPIRAS